MAPSDSDAAVDRSVLDRYRTMADDAFVDSIVEQFVTESAASVAEIGAALAAGVPGRLADAAHRLKGSSATVGARTLAPLCGEIEALARRSDLEQVTRLFAAVVAEFAQVRHELSPFGSARRRDKLTGHAVIL